jgi:hypothetical protein
MLFRKDGDFVGDPHMKLLTAIALATLVATPAFAAKKHSAISPQAAAAQASVPSEQDNSAVDPYTVIVNGRIVGRDPDRNVRLMLIRDPMADAS